MCNDRIIRRFAGTFVLISLALGWWIHPAWFFFTAFVGLNLLQSSFTAFCPLERMLGLAGLAGCTARTPAGDLEAAAAGPLAKLSPESGPAGKLPKPSGD